MFVSEVKRPRIRRYPNPSAQIAPQPATVDLAARPKQQDRSSKKRVVALLIGTGCLLLIAGAIGSWLLLRHSPPSVDPFNTTILAATKFTLYYPESIPLTYHTDLKSVSTPQPGVVVFDLINPHGQKIYISQETRPSEFNFGGYYNDFTDLREKVINQGTIATGYINGGQTVIGSLVTNGTWVIANTKDHTVTPTELTALLQSLTLSN
jgi:hypothetical protein